MQLISEKNRTGSKGTSKEQMKGKTQREYVFK
jgi:hypothetical protein